MVELRRGNLLEADTEALVNTVNTVGVMGKGIASQFKRAFPAVFTAYEKDCKAGKVELGRMHVVDCGGLGHGPRWVINFPTKKHWRGKSRLSDIEAGLLDLARVIKELKIKSIALPPLGCGHGGLTWDDVLPRIKATLGDLAGVRVLVFEPVGAPRAEEMVNRTERPKLTDGIAALILLIKRYLDGLLDPCVTLLEVHKMMYFLQQTGQLPRLKYIKGIYGPYSPNLRHSLARMEGHFTSGFGDAAEQPGKELDLLKGAAEEAEEYLEVGNHAQLRDAIGRVNRLIDGFEDPQGMELLSSVHWVMTNEPKACEDPDEAVAAVHDWNEHKRRVLKPEAIVKAWRRLKDQGWACV